MSRDTDPARFFERAEGFFCALSRKRNLGIAIGRWEHPRRGPLRVIAVYGWIGALYVTLAVAAPAPWWERGQVSLWWYLSDRTEPFEFKHIGGRLRAPVSQTTTVGFLSMAKKVLLDLRWLERQTSVEAVFADQFERNVAPIAKFREAGEDPDNELPTEGPEEP